MQQNQTKAKSKNQRIIKKRGKYDKINSSLI